ncbi:MAG: M23 family metallopeptidase [Prevotella sp.]
MAQTEFSLLEQQQISIETPGLFDKSNTFTIDFASLPISEYCFPLPVGKAQNGSDNYMEITTKHGDAVKAMFAGTVRISKKHKTMGNTIVIRHDNGLETVYSRNTQNLVKVGERVKAGQTIAIVGGEKGRVFCTFAMMVNGCRINPDIILSTKSHRLLRQTVMFKKSGFYVDLSVIHNENDKEERMKELVNADVFGGGNKFTLNLADLNPNEWCYPLPSAKVISPYGRRGGRSHTGVDLKTKPNDNILAAFDGIVTMSQTYHGYGKCIKIKHPNGIETLYSHNSKNLVKVGDIVKAGQVIALTGRTGRATTEHLHFECRINGNNFNPALIFDHARHSIRLDQLTFTKRSGGGVSIKAEKNYMAKGK